MQAADLRLSTESDIIREKIRRFYFDYRCEHAANHEPEAATTSETPPVAASRNHAPTPDLRCRACPGPASCCRCSWRCSTSRTGNADGSGVSDLPSFGVSDPDRLCPRLFVLLALVAAPASAAPIEDYAVVPAADEVPAAGPSRARRCSGRLDGRATYGGALRRHLAPLHSASTSEHQEGRAFDWTLDADEEGGPAPGEGLPGPPCSPPTGTATPTPGRAGWASCTSSGTTTCTPPGTSSSPRTTSARAARAPRTCSTTLRHRDHLHVSLTRAGGRPGGPAGTTGPRASQPVDRALVALPPATGVACRQLRSAPGGASAARSASRECSTARSASPRVPATARSSRQEVSRPLGFQPSTSSALRDDGPV